MILVVVVNPRDRLHTGVIRRGSLYSLRGRLPKLASRLGDLALANSLQSAVADRSIYEDAYIFARALHHLNNLNERDYIAYRRIFDLVFDHLPPPDLLIYLRAPVEVLMDRIRSRGREIETGITADYLALLDSFYEEWMVVEREALHWQALEALATLAAYQEGRGDYAAAIASARAGGAGRRCGRKSDERLCGIRLACGAEADQVPPRERAPARETCR